MQTPVRVVIPLGATAVSDWGNVQVSNHLLTRVARCAPVNATLGASRPGMVQESIGPRNKILPVWTVGMSAIVLAPS